MEENPQDKAIAYLLEVSQRRQGKVFEDDLSSLCESGIQYAAAILYAEYLGIYVIGRIPAWVRRLRKFPRAVPPTLREGVHKILTIQNVELTDEGVLQSRKGIPLRKL